MAWRQNLGGSEQHLTRAAAAARTRTQRPGKHLAVRASELVVKPDFQILRRYRRPLLLRLEHTHRPTLEDYVHRATRLGSSRSLNLRIGISRRLQPWVVPGTADLARVADGARKNNNAITVKMAGKGDPRRKEVPQLLLPRSNDQTFAHPQVGSGPMRKFGEYAFLKDSRYARQAKS